MLTAASITELTIEFAPKAIFAEWLAKYFDGAAHVVGANAAVTFPKCVFAFGNSPRLQPLSDPAVAPPKAECEIRVVGLPVSESDTFYRDGKLATATMSFNFWITAKSEVARESEKLCQDTGQLLKALLANPATAYELAQKGIGHVEPRPPEPMPAGMGVVRLLVCKATLQFQIV